MLSHTLAKMLLAMDDAPVVIRGRNALLEAGGAKEVVVKRHPEHQFYKPFVGLWFDANKDDKDSVRAIEIR